MFGTTYDDGSKLRKRYESIDEMTIDIPAPNPFKMFPACLMTTATSNPPAACNKDYRNEISLLSIVNYLQ